MTRLTWAPETRWPLAIALSIALALAGCSDNPTSNNGEGDTGAAPVDAGADLGAPDMGPPTCSTADECTGAWAGWECVGGVCTDCDAGDEDCSCRLNGTCQTGLRCDEDSSTCVVCEPGQEQCACDESGACDEGLVCDEGACVPDTCTDGALDCPCNPDDTCDEGAYCNDMGVCNACTSDIPGCACDEGGTCAGENYCDDQDVCQTCPDSDLPIGCACQDSIDCAVGLTCDADASECRERQGCDVLCVPNQECDESSAGDAVCVVETCVDGYEWNSDTGTCDEIIRYTCDGRAGSTDLSITCAMQNQECVEVGGDGFCVTTCTAIASQCDADNRVCQPAALGADAFCGACAIGYVDDGNGACVVDTSLNCSTFGDPDSIADDCALANQVCDELPGGGAQCGACLEGFVLDPSTNSCVSRSLCGDRFCTDTEFCEHPQTSAAPSCQPRPCADGEAFDGASCVACNISCDADGTYPTTIDGACACASDVYCAFQYDGASDRCFTSECGAGEARTPGGQCITCNITCGQIDGQLSRIWPETTADGSCTCETQQGYYADPGGNLVPKQCDADTDGWINRSAAEVLESARNINIGGITQDDALLANFRCEVRQIDRFVLKNEWGQSRNVALCGDTMIDYAPGQPSGCAPPNTLEVLTLLEADALDDDDSILNDATTLPAYGGRQVGAKEINGLTKMCVSLTGDFNQNGVEDIQEEHAIERTRLSPNIIFNGTTPNEDFAFHSVSYFAELHRGYFVDGGGSGVPGSYVIEERSRCDGDVGPGYNGSTSGYWQSCTRNRRGDFVYADSHTGHDFAHYSCSDNTGGACDLLSPAIIEGVDADNDRIDDHGVCDQTGPLPDEPWRGMTHHSQFQCMVAKTNPSALSPEELALGRIYQSGEADPQAHEFNACVAVDCAAGAMGCTQSTSQGVGQPDLVELDCTPIERPAVSNDDVGWVSIRYNPENSANTLARPYQRGCIDESYGLDGTDGWEYLCPGYTLDLGPNDDSCASANNATCEDGGDGSSAATCAIGTDLTDCGARSRDNSDALLTAGNPGDSGKLICSCNRFYGGANCEVACAEITGGGGSSYLHVGDRDRGYTPDEAAEWACAVGGDNYCQLHPAVPSENFGGGRRGYWVCGDTALSYDTSLSPSIDAVSPNTNANYTLRGGIPTTPVVRTELTGSGTVDNVTRTYSLF